MKRLLYNLKSFPSIRPKYSAVKTNTYLELFSVGDLILQFYFAFHDGNITSSSNKYTMHIADCGVESWSLERVYF